MTPSWRTVPIGRHLVDVPEDATLVPQWRYNTDPLVFRNDIRTDMAYDAMINQREQALRAAPHEQYGSLFVQRVDHITIGASHWCHGIGRGARSCINSIRTSVLAAGL